MGEGLRPFTKTYDIRPGLEPGFSFLALDHRADVYKHASWHAYLPKAGPEFWLSDFDSLALLFQLLMVVLPRCLRVSPTKELLTLRILFLQPQAKQVFVFRINFRTHNAPRESRLRTRFG